MDPFLFPSCAACIQQCRSPAPSFTQAAPPHPTLLTPPHPTNQSTTSAFLCPHVSYLLHHLPISRTASLTSLKQLTCVCYICCLFEKQVAGALLTAKMRAGSASNILLLLLFRCRLG